MTATDVVSASTQAQSGKSCPNSKESSPVKVKTPDCVQEEASTHLATGKRHLLVSDVPSAVASLAQACELLSTQFGETAKECAESYLYYGKALLELSRLESGVLGNALDGVPEEGDDANNSRVEDPTKMTEEEKKEVGEKVGEALEENFQSLQKKDDKDVTKEGEKKSKETKGGETKSEESKVGGAKSEESKDKESTEDEGMEEGDDSEAEESNGEEMDADKSTTEGESVEKKDEEEEPSNLQLAWEMLELAKVVYTKQVDSGEGNKAEVEEKLCSAMLALGEVSLENENYSQAVEDIQLCLKKQESLPKDSRIVAETHYHLGVALGFNSQFEEAVDSLSSAIKIIKERIKFIKEGVKLPKKSPTKDEKKEVTELEALIPEIEEKIADTKDMKKEAEAKTKDGSEGLSSSSGDKTETKNVTSIAVKRKAGDEDAKSKKVVSEKEKTAAAS